MKMLDNKKTIVVPYDFSELSQAALDEALTLAESPDQVEVLHVATVPTAVEPGVAWGAFSIDEVCQSVNERFRELIQRNCHTRLRFTILHGDPGTRIADHARDAGAGLIVISSHGRSGLSRLMLGSVAERVVRLAHCPVLVLRNGKKASPAEFS